MNKSVESLNKQLVSYIETEILPQYNEFDNGHNLLHISNVIRESLALAEDLSINKNMVYTIAAFHDLGIKYGRDSHHLSSAQLLMENQNLKKWFTSDELAVIKEAIEDHRASSKNPPRSIYGKVVAEADREISIKRVLQRTLQYGLKTHPHLSFEEHFERCYMHLQEKYGQNGYLKLWFKNGKNAQNLRELQQLILDKDKLKNEFRKYYNEEQEK